jgi:hypothetical protein
MYIHVKARYIKAAFNQTGGLSAGLNASQKLKTDPESLLRSHYIP